MASYQATPKLAVGAGPIITSSTVSFSPAFFAPNPSRGPFGLPTFPAGTNARPFWGRRVPAWDALYNVSSNWNFGFSYKSPNWLEKWSYNSSTPNGTARYIGVQAELPTILSWGVAYKGLPKTLIDVDFRYIDYANASLFGQKPSDGGLGWRSVFAVATGIQYQLSDRVTLRAGYLYNTNPIPATNTLFNVQAPAITTNTLSLGFSTKLTADITATAAWVHGFRNSITGGVEQIPGGSARVDLQTDSLVFGLNVQFGKPRRLVPSPTSDDGYTVPASLPAVTSSDPAPRPLADSVVPASTSSTPTAAALTAPESRQ